MNELNKDELRRLAEAIKEGCGLQGENAEEAMYDFECAATPDAVLLLLDECDRLQATCEGLDRQNDAIAEEIGKVAAERDAALAELAELREQACALEIWREMAFKAHPNIDIDIEALK
jgi:hypothetical protein